METKESNGMKKKQIKTNLRPLFVLLFYGSKSLDYISSSKVGGSDSVGSYIILP